ncbi:hypothetical protein [Rhizobium sp. MHM7A]|uniref:hypothetical protein n=1 Tax=Rhizobium sp. MHM7A TaxID=2583233 RepID=UPI001105A700|nr:hypothetical protein [Rhizobium sp. MHM7A]TLX16408.1 hypothetical protein FFR93_03485 [Rhizobium sp. MHM7A]
MTDNSNENPAVDLRELHVPYSKGDWLETTGESQLQIARVREAYWYRNSDGEVKLYGDLWLYNYNGDRIGRESPALGGPQTYEPFCDLSSYQRIEEPEFPIGLHAYDTGETSYTFRYQTKAKVLGPRKPRKKAKPVKAVAKVVVVESNNGFDPQAEARALKIAAENLRDTARTLPAEARALVIEKAEGLERQAAALLSPAD